MPRASRTNPELWLVGREDLEQNKIAICNFGPISRHNQNAPTDMKIDDRLFGFMFVYRGEEFG